MMWLPDTDAILTGGPIADDPLNRTLLARWKAVPDWTGPVFRDLCGQYHGAFSGSGSSNGWRSTARAGGSGEVLFDGSLYATVGAVRGLAGLQVPLTIAGWIKLGSSSNFPTMFSLYTATTSSKLLSILRADSGVLKYYCANSSGNFQNFGSMSLTVGAWQSVCAIVSGSIASPSLKIWMDKTSQSFTPGALTSTPDLTVPAIVGWDNSGLSLSRFVGSLDDLWVAGRAWSDAEYLRWREVTQTNFDPTLARVPRSYGLPNTATASRLLNLRRRSAAA